MGQPSLAKAIERVAPCHRVQVGSRWVKHLSGAALKTSKHQEMALGL